MKSFFNLTLLLASYCIRYGTGPKEESEKDFKFDLVAHIAIESVSQIHDSDWSTFLDSISGRYEIAIEQIKKFTTLDSSYYTGAFSTAAFTGDTLFVSSYGLINAIITYDDRKNCYKKILFVFRNDKVKSTDYKLIYSSCDRDASTDYGSMDYKILSDSVFETIETYIPGNTEKLRKEKIRWKIGKKGIIERLIKK